MSRGHDHERGAPGPGPGPSHRCGPSCLGVHAVMQCDAEDVLRPYHHVYALREGEVPPPHNPMFRLHVGWVKAQRDRPVDERQPVWAMFNRNGYLVFIPGRHNLNGEGPVRNPLKDSRGRIADETDEFSTSFFPEFREHEGFVPFAKEVGRRTLLGECRLCGKHPDAANPTNPSYGR